MRALLKRLIQSHDGQDLIEYGLLVGIITLGAIGAVIAIGPKVATYFTSVDKLLP